MFLEKFKYFVTDVDGVLTDGGFYYNDQGKVFKKFGPHDSDGFNILRSLNFKILAISADKRGFKITHKRLNDMSIDIYHVPENVRLNWVSERVNLSETIFVGDGYHDISLLSKCGFGISPINSPNIVKEHADYITENHGGNGVILGVCFTYKKE